MTTRHFLSLYDLGADGIRSIVSRAIELKKEQPGENGWPLAGRTLAMLFEKSSTRTRVSFETGMTRLGGHAIFLSPEHTQVGRGEPIEDTARVLSKMVDAVMIRNHSQQTLERFAEFSDIPVINGLTEKLHPCQLLADILTYTEQRGDISGSTVAWIGDGNNMCRSYMNAAQILDFKLNIATPSGYEPNIQSGEPLPANATHFKDPKEAVKNADLVVTDTWTSMGDEAARETRLRAFANFHVDKDLMALADRDALFMHCLPAHRGEEASAEMLDGPNSIVWEEAGNRLHAQSALVLHLLGK